MDLRQFFQVIEATKPEKLPPLPIEQLEKYHSYLVEMRQWIVDGTNVELRRYHMELIRREIELRRMEARSERQHTEAIALGKQTLDVSDCTLWWTKIVAAIAVVAVVTAVILGIAQIWLSNTVPSTSNRALPVSSPQNLTPKSESPAPESTASISTTSPQPTAGNMPSPEQP